MDIVLMREDRDCQVAAIATACGVSYEQAKKATMHRDLMGFLESPVFGNPLNLYLSIAKLGFWKKNVTLSELVSGDVVNGKTIVLVHDPDSPNFNQHWVVYGGVVDSLEGGAKRYILHWGTGNTPKIVTEQKLKDLYEKGWPNCSFTVYKANVFKVMLERIKLFFARLLSCVKQ